ncbi:putative peptidase S28, alpha/Beta hydrolase [Helianthus anomalus]
MVHNKLNGLESLNLKLNRKNVENPSLASSGVVLVVYNFTEFDQQVGESAGPECKAVLQEVTQLVEEKLAPNPHLMLPRVVGYFFKLKIDGDFLYFLADVAAIAVPFGSMQKCVFERVYPVVDATNLYYGGTDIAGSKMVFTNGSQDPWRHASKQVSSPSCWQ